MQQEGGSAEGGANEQNPHGVNTRRRRASNCCCCCGCGGNMSACLNDGPSPASSSSEGDDIKLNCLKNEYESRPSPPENPCRDAAVGLLMIFFAAVSAALQLYAICISKVLPYSGVWWLDAIKDDWHYCVFIPLGILTSAFFIYWNWIALKFFQNSPTNVTGCST